MTLGLDIAKTTQRNIIFKCKISSCSPYFKQNPGAHYMTNVSVFMFQDCTAHSYYKSSLPTEKPRLVHKRSSSFELNFDRMKVAASQLTYTYVRRMRFCGIRLRHEMPRGLLSPPILKGFFFPVSLSLLLITDRQN